MTPETLVETCRHNFLTPILIQMGVIECKTWKQLQEHGQAAEKLIRVNDPVKVSADNWSFFQNHGAVSVVRILYPSRVRIMPFESTIASSDRMIAAWIKRNALVQFLLSIRRRALFRKRDKNVILVDRRSPYSPEATPSKS